MSSPQDAPTPAPDELAVTIDAVDAVDDPSGDDRRPPGASAPGRGEVATLDYTELEAVPRRHYLIGAEIARGGMGRVVAARDLRLGRDVAIKELLPRKRDAAPRFEQEARITARLQHPAIIHLYEAGVWPTGEPFYAMPRVVGRTLDVVVAERGTLSERLGLVPNVIAVVDALAYAHSQRVMHRDLKPANVLVGEFGETVVIDWGLAKDLATAAGDAAGAPGPPDSLVGDVVGTPAYMAPEQARGDHVDERTDVYALGALLYTVLAGRAPYTGPSSRRVLEAVLAGSPPTLRSVEPGVPADLVAIVVKAMARAPADRYPTATELATDLKRFQTGQLVAAHHYSAGERLRRWLGRHRGMVSLAAVAVLALGLVATVSVRRILAEKRTAEHRRAALLEEQGRTQLLAGRAGRALVYLQEAVARGRGGAMQFLIADAMRPFETMVARLPVGAAVHAAAYSPDGGTIVTGGDDGAIIWRLRDRRAVAHLGPGAVRTVRYDPSGAVIVTAGDDGVARVWAAPGGALRYETTPQRGPIHDVAFSPDGTFLVTAGDDGKARLWATSTAKLLATLDGHDGPVRSVRVSPDNHRVATASDDGTAAVWTWYTDDAWPLRGHGGRVTSVRFSPDGRWVLTAGDDRRAIVWDPSTGKQMLTLTHGSTVTAAEWSRDGARVVTASADHTARVWRMPALTVDAPAELLPAATLAGHSDIVLDARFDVSGTRVVTVGRDRTVRLWAADDGEQLAAFEGHADLIDAIDLSPDGTQLVTGSRDGTAQLWDARAQERAPIDVGEEIRGLALSPDGATLVTGTTNGDVLVWPSDGGDPLTTARHRASVEAVAFSPDGTRLVSGGDDGTALIAGVADPEAGAIRLAHGRPVLAVAFSPDGRQVATGCADGVLRVWDAGDGRPLHELGGHAGAVDAIAWSGDGARLVSGGTDGGARVWDARTGTQLGAPVAIGRVVYGVALDDDGSWAAAGGDGATPQVWRVGGVAGAVSLEGPTSVVSALAFTPDGSRLITAGVDAAVRVWDARSGKLLGVREGHRGPILWNGLALSADGIIAATASADRAVRFWNLRAPPRTAASLRAFVVDRVPWCLDDDDQPRRVDPTTGPGGACGERQRAGPRAE